MISRKYFVSTLIFATVLSLASNAESRGLLGGARIVLKEGRLADALRDLSVRSGSDLLFAPDVVGELRNRRVAGGLQVEPILSRLLDGTGLSYRRVGDGTYIVYRPEQEQPTALPEVLVIGRKAQNADIRRTQNDIQGYRVATAADIRSSHVDNLDQFLRSRQSNNAERFGPASDPREGYAGNRSEMNFHGLGPNQTLVLVDGTRMPSTLSQFFALELNQPDVNGVPLLAIDRIETLTGTAGGIYGPGATGGVVNIILKRDYRGAEISTAYGVTDRGDGRRRRVDGRIGFTPDDGATDIMINVSRAESEGLRFGDRDFVQRARLADIAQNPASLRYTFADGVIVSSLYGENLRLSPALGGASLGSTFTYLPLGVGAGDGSTLLANAGKVPDALSPDGNGVLRSLTSSTTVTSLLFNARHRFGQHVEAVVDFIGWENEGRSVSGFNITGWQTGLPAVMKRQPGRPVTDAFPFAQPVEVVFPFPGMEAYARNRMRTLRTSAKIIFDLPASWRGEASYSVGETRNRFREEGFAFDQNFPLSMFLMQPGANGEPTPEPLGSWADFVATIQAYKIPHTVLFERKLRLGDFAVRLGGPLLRRAAGDVALSLSAERRVEKASLTPWDENGSLNTPNGVDHSFSITTTSLYGELRAPVLSRASSRPLLRGLELQLAARYDANQADIPSTAFLGPRSQYDKAGTVYTAGLRVFPLDALLLRASIATGVSPPTPQQMSEGRTTLPAYQLTDPARGGQLVALNNTVVLLQRGSTALRPERAQTIALGVAYNPDEGPGPRVSLDYTRTRKRGEISDVGAAFVVANEALYPDRIVRAAVTPADIAAGYSAGAITQIDATYMNIGRTNVDAFDLHLDEAFRLRRDNTLRLFAAATWTPRLTRQVAPDRPVVDYVATNDGPLEWRGGAGAVWERGDFSMRLDAQYYGSYVAVEASSVSARSSANLSARRVPAQVYLDAELAWRLRLARWRPDVRDVEIRFGIQNVLDHDPPVDTSDFGYSLYGDPRGRRFELSATARF